MKHTALDKGEKLLRKHKKWKQWQKIVGVMACLVVFCTTYALILPAITLSAEISSGETATISVGETVTLKGTDLGYGGDSWSIGTNEESVVVEPGGSSAVITGKANGTATITHTYNTKKNGSKSASETFTVIVTDNSGSEDEIQKEAAGADYTVTVKGNKSVLTDDVTLHVEDYNTTESDYQDYYNALKTDLERASSSSVNDDSFDFLHMYHIYLTKEGVGGEYIPTGNVNLQVTITYAAPPENWSKVNWVGHYKKSGNQVSPMDISDGSSSSAGVKKIKVSGNSITFHIQSFSVFPVAALADASGGESGGDGGSTASDGSILTQDQLSWIGGSNSNEWQIVDQEYEGNAGTDKKTSSDGNVRVQKNVIPTGVENEFLVYLSVDTKQLFSEFFESATYKATTSNNYHDPKNLGTIVEAMTGNKDVDVVGTSTIYENNASFTILSSEGELLADNITLYWSQANNVTIYLELNDGSDKKYVLTGLKIKTGEKKVLMLSEESERLIMSNIAQKAVLDHVIDQMGDYIEFVSVVSGDYKETPAYDASTQTLTWKPVVKANPAIDKVKTDETKNVSWIDHDGNVRNETVYEYTSWALNTAELVYKVRLNVAKEGFNSAADNMNSDVTEKESYPVNESAILTYDDGNGGEGGTVDFQQPYVRGLLYDLQFDKVDAEDANIKLSGAVFKLTDASGVEEYAVSEAQAESEKGTYRAENLPAGTYTLEEVTAPKGYQKKENSFWEVPLCYTSDRSSVTQDTAKMSNMISVGSPGSIGSQITNEKIKAVYADLIKTDMSYTALSGADFSIYDTDPTNEGAVPITEYESISVGENGVIADNIPLETGKTYYLVENKAPDGYQMPGSNVALTIDASNTEAPVSASGGDGTVEITSEKQNVGDTEATVYVIKIPNNPGFRLPDTGGPGNWIYYLSGGLLILTACIIYGYSLRRKRERRLKV